MGCNCKSTRSVVHAIATPSSAFAQNGIFPISFTHVNHSEAFQIHLGRLSFLETWLFINHSLKLALIGPKYSSPRAGLTLLHIHRPAHLNFFVFPWWTDSFLIEWTPMHPCKPSDQPHPWSEVKYSGHKSQDHTTQMQTEPTTLSKLSERIQISNLACIARPNSCIHG